MMSVTVQPGPIFGRAVDLFDNRPYIAMIQPGIDYDTTPEGRFLMINRRPQESDGAGALAQVLTVVTHWTDELRARVK
jgi:hypothetical protein